MDIQAGIFKNSLSLSIWKNKQQIDFLLSNMTLIENNIKNYLDNISVDFPYLTDHSLKHSKALWEYSNIIVGDQKTFLNPMECFVLHAAFLIHDAGMCYSILNNKKEIQNDLIYKDFIKNKQNTDETIEEALFYTIRQRHGDYAIRIATEKLADGKYLIPDTGLREELGLLIGKISKSHTCNVNYIEREFGPTYCNPNFPTSWTIDCQKLSFILRTADAAHIDNLRTPKTLKKIVDVPDGSREHWTFQKKLGFPQLSEDGLLMYTTNKPFDESEQKAWWFCFNALKVLDNELKQANEYFEVNTDLSLNAKGVKCINDTLELGKKYIRTTGWTTIDTNVKVSNPVNIAAKLGGITLYGQPSIALRELCQNSIDAINLYRIHTGQDNEKVGEIKITINEEDGKLYLTVTDNGIGMSQTIMTNQLLDFGGSYWKSNNFKYDFEGAIAKGFESIGKFGIGFFSVFMLGEKVTITSWKYGTAVHQMKTLDFYDGLNSNPIIRNPNETEKSQIIDRGTSIRIELSENPYMEKVGFIRKHSNTFDTLYDICRYYVPSSNVKLSIYDLDGSKKVIPPNIFKTLSFGDFIRYVFTSNNYIDDSIFFKLWEKIGVEMIEIIDDSKTVGKLALLPPNGNYIMSSVSVIISKGITVNNISNLAGFLTTNEVITIKRNEFKSNISYKAIKEWAIKTKYKIDSEGLSDVYNQAYYCMCISFGLHNQDTPILLSKIDGIYDTISIKQLNDYLNSNSILKIHQEGHISAVREETCDGFIYFSYNNPFMKLVKEEERKCLNEYSPFIHQLVKNIWGEYTVTEGVDKKSMIHSLELPYFQIKELRKTE